MRSRFRLRRASSRTLIRSHERHLAIGRRRDAAAASHEARPNSRPERERVLLDSRANAAHPSHPHPIARTLARSEEGGTQVLQRLCACFGSRPERGRVRTQNRSTRYRHRTLIRSHDRHHTIGRGRDAKVSPHPCVVGIASRNSCSRNLLYPWPVVKRGANHLPRRRECNRREAVDDRAKPDARDDREWEEPECETHDGAREQCRARNTEREP